MTTAPDFTNVRVLLVDDEPDTLEMLRTYLAQQGLLVRCETRAEDAIAAVAEFRPAVVITDISMPELDGLDLVHQLRLKSKSLPVIAITAHYDEEGLRARIQKAGFTLTLVKPVDPRAVVDAIGVVLRR
jgi:DNA-binding response OmpR family regulator